MRCVFLLKNKPIILLCKLLAFIILIECFFYLNLNIYGKVDDSKLHAICACLYDATDGRVLYSKNGEEVRAMASTT